MTPPPNPLQVDLDQNHYITLDHDGSYSYSTPAAPNLTLSQVASAGAGYVVQGGSATIRDFRVLPMPTPNGLMVTVTFTVSNRVGSPVLWIPAAGVLLSAKP